MGAVYSVLPVNRDVMTWLQSLEPAYPEVLTQGRYPTPQEVRMILDGLSDHVVEYTINDQTLRVTISQASSEMWASLVIMDYNRAEDENSPHEFYFEKGWSELVLEILDKLSEICGPLVLVPHSGDKPTLVSRP